MAGVSARGGERATAANPPQEGKHVFHGVQDALPGGPGRAHVPE